MVVVSVLTVIILFAVSVLNTQDRQKKLFGQACSQYIYGSVQNYIENAVTGKLIFTGNTNIFPDVYTVAFGQTGQQIVFGYSVAGVTGTMASYTLNNQSSMIGLGCDKSISMQMTGATMTITVQRNLVSTLAQSSFSLGSPSQITGQVVLQRCAVVPDGNPCQDAFRIDIDKRMQNVSGIPCRVTNAGGSCLVW